MKLDLICMLFDLLEFWISFIITAHFSSKDPDAQVLTEQVPSLIWEQCQCFIKNKPFAGDLHSSKFCAASAQIQLQWQLLQTARKKDLEKRDHKNKKCHLSKILKWQRRLSSWHVPGVPAADVLIFLTAALDIVGKRQAVRPAVLFLCIDPSLHVEHLAPSLYCCRKQSAEYFSGSDWTDWTPSQKSTECWINTLLRLSSGL